MPPKVSVLMPVYNAEAHLAEAIDSILGQTFQDFELLVAEDGSTDRSLALLQSYQDPRLRIIRDGQNRKLIYRLNQLLDQAQAPFLARMDADDVALPERLEKQVSYLEQHPETALCGTLVDFIGEWQPHHKQWLQQLKTFAPSFGLLFANIIVHPTVMLRKNLVEELALRFDRQHLHCEDYGFWLAMLPNARLANLQEVLLHYRVHGGNISQVYRQTQISNVEQLLRAELSKLGLEPSVEQMQRHRQLLVKIPRRFEELQKDFRWLEQLKAANRRQQHYPAAAFDHFLGQLAQNLEARYYQATGTHKSLPKKLIYRSRKLLRQMQHTLFH